MQRDLAQEHALKKQNEKQTKQRLRKNVLYPINERGTRADILIAPCKVCGRRGFVTREDRRCHCEHNHLGTECRLNYCLRVAKKEEDNNAD